MAFKALNTRNVRRDDRLMPLPLALGEYETNLQNEAQEKSGLAQSCGYPAPLHKGTSKHSLGSVATQVKTRASPSGPPLSQGLRVSFSTAMDLRLHKAPFSANLSI